MQVKKQQLELGMEEQTGSKSGNVYIKAVYCHPAYLTYMQCAAAAAKSLQLCPILCDPIDGSPPGSPIPGVLQSRTLEWVAISFSKAWKWKVKVKMLSRVRLLATPWTTAHQAPPSMGLPRREYWSGVPLPSPVASSIYSISPFNSKIAQVWLLILFIPCFHFVNEQTEILKKK